MAIVKRRGNAGYIRTRNCVHSFEITGAVQRISTVDNSNPFVGTNAWDETSIRIGNIELIPRGERNNMPEEIRTLLEKSNIASPTLERKKNLLFGDGLMAYEMDFETGIPIRKWVEDDDIKGWLDSWDVDTYLDNILTDFFSENKYYSMFVRNRGPRNGSSGMINRLEHKMNFESFPEWPDSKGEINNIYIGSYSKLSVFNLKRYPAYEPEDPFKHPRSISYFNNYTYGRKKYSPPSYQGAINWINVGANVPIILLSLDDNMLTLKYHIKSPKSYWDAKREDLKTEAKLANVKYEEEMLEQLKDDMFSDIGDMLSGVDNVGKFFDSEYVVNQYGKLEGWEIEAIDMKVKDFIMAELAIAKRSDLEIASGMGLAPSLSNLSMDGNLSSGSEQLYALKLHLGTDTVLNEIRTLKALNLAKKANFPDNKRNIGFYHKVIKVEEEITPEKRVKNTV